jgi:transposase
LYLAFELGAQTWQLGFTIGFGQTPRRRTLAAGARDALQAEVQQAKKRFGLPETARVLSCYEAGREGFWLHRYLGSVGIENLIVDSASIEVKRRKRRVKTDRLDLGKLLRMLVRYDLGEPQVWSVVRVPSVAAEDRRHLHRELATLKSARTQHTNRIKGLLAGQGIQLAVNGAFLTQIEAVRQWDGTALPRGLLARLQREYARRQLVNQQIQVLDTHRLALIRTAHGPEIDQVRQLMRLKGIGPNYAWTYVMEFFSWRTFRNRRELAGLAGLTPTPHQSGATAREKGISKAGNRYVRALAIEMAWGWLHHQPASHLSHWYQQRFGSGSKRVRKIGIVALARRLLIELWRYLETGAIPTGAVLKSHLR